MSKRTNKNDPINWESKIISLSELKPHPLNPRKFTEKGLEDLEKSIKSIGKAQPLNVTQEGLVLSGNARLQVLNKMGVDKIECLVANRKLTDKEEKEVLVRLNKNVAGEFDNDILADSFEVDDLLEQGFTEDELDFGEVDTETEDDFEGSNEEIGDYEIESEGKFVFKYGAEEYIRLMARFNKLRRGGESNESLFVRMIKICEEK